jgi:hypothetical protein
MTVSTIGNDEAEGVNIAEFFEQAIIEARGSIAQVATTLRTKYGASDSFVALCMAGIAGEYLSEAKRRNESFHLLQLISDEGSRGYERQVEN